MKSDISDVNDLVGVPAEIPARAVAEMREKGMDAGVCLLLSRLVLNLAVFHVDRVERVYGDLPELWSTSWNLETKRKIVAYIDKYNRRDDQRRRPRNSTFHGVRYLASDGSSTYKREFYLFGRATDSRTLRKNSRRHCVVRAGDP
jgi:hypothetical protein